MWTKYLEIILTKKGGGEGKGGIFRNYCGCTIFAFSHFYDIYTNFAVEMIVIQDRLLLCEEHDLRDIVLESDLHWLINTLHSGYCSYGVSDNNEPTSCNVRVDFKPSLTSFTKGTKWLTH